MAKAEDALTENLNAFVAFARKRVGDPELAADLVQDSLLKAFKSAGRTARWRGRGDVVLSHPAPFHH